MPNQANKSNDKSGIVRSKKNSTMPYTQKQGKGGNATKQSKGKGKKGNTGISSNEESKTASGGSAND